MLFELFFRLDARGRRRVAPLGWAMLAVSIFVGVGLAAFGIRLYSDRIVEALATKSPGTIVPAGVDWTLSKEVLRGGTEVYVAPEDVERQLVLAFIEAWNALSFQGGFPDEGRVQEILMQYYWPNSVAYEGAAELIRAARQTGHYWRQEIVGQFSLSELIEFKQNGLDATFIVGFPAENIRRELIDITTGKVITSSPKDILLRVTMRYDTGAKRWKVLEVSLP